MTRTLLSTVLTACLATVSLAAHHSYAAFEPTRTMFEVSVEAIVIQNPHTLIDLKAPDGQRYRIVFMAVSALRRAFVGGAAGLTEKLQVGDTLLVSGRLKRGGEVIEVCSAQFDGAAGPIYPVNRPALVRPQGPGPWPEVAVSESLPARATAQASNR